MVKVAFRYYNTLRLRDRLQLSFMTGLHASGQYIKVWRRKTAGTVQGWHKSLCSEVSVRAQPPATNPVLCVWPCTARGMHCRHHHYCHCEFTATLTETGHTHVCQ